jgi:hypothetical protein
VSQIVNESAASWNASDPDFDWALSTAGWALASNETVMLHVLIFIGLAPIFSRDDSDDSRKSPRMTKEVITRGWLRDTLDKALSEGMAKPTPVQQFIVAILHGNTIETPTQYRGSKYGKPDTDKAA